MNEKSRNALLWAAAGAGALITARAVLRSRRAYDFAGKTVLIVGGSRGLGLVLAREFAREGARLAICARDEAELARARDDLQRRGAEVISVPCDVANKEQVDEMMREVRARFNEINVLINNVGVIQVGPLEVMTLEDFDEAIRTHFWAPLYTTLNALPEMRARRDGSRIVNISSIGGKISVPHLVPYSASKFALVGLSEGLRAELAKDNVVVTTVCPGLMRTGSPLNAFFKGDNKAEYAWFSISDSLPLTSMNAERAARQIINACRRGDAEIVLSVQAELAVLFHNLFPGLTADILGAINKLLPAPDGIGRRRAKGKDSQSDVSPSPLTALSEEAARANNEV